MKIVFAILLTLLPVLAFGAGGGHGGGHDGIPADFYWSVLNFSLYAILLFVLLKGKVVAAFKDRATTFQAAAGKAKAAKDEAEAQRRAIADRIRTLETTAEESMRRAKQEAEGIKQKTLAEAEATAQAMEKEAQRTIAIEVEKARAQLKGEMLEQSIQVSKKLLTDKMAANDQQRLQTEFLQKIEVGQS